GRRACRDADPDPCGPETNADVLRPDGTPADTTFVWDPFTDRLVAIFQNGKSTAAAGATTGVGSLDGLVRQFVHGQRGVDDLLEVDVDDAGTVKRYVTETDEAGTGSLQTIINGSDGH